MIVAFASTVVAFVVAALGNLVAAGLTGRAPVWDADATSPAAFAAAITLLQLTGFTLGALIRSSAGAIVAYLLYAFVLPGVLTLLAMYQEWFRDLRPWIDAKLTQDDHARWPVRRRVVASRGHVVRVARRPPHRRRPERPACGGEVMSETRNHTAAMSAPQQHQPPAVTTTRAVVQHTYGSPSVLRVEDVPLPAPTPDQVLVRVEAASVNAQDWHIMRGEPRIARLMAPAVFRLGRPRIPVRGTDLVGVVVAVGADVREWHPATGSSARAPRPSPTMPSPAPTSSRHSP